MNWYWYYPLWTRTAGMQGLIPSCPSKLQSNTPLKLNDRGRANRGSKVVRVLAFLAMECVIPAWYDLILSTLKPGRIPKVIEVYGKVSSSLTGFDCPIRRSPRVPGQLPSSPAKGSPGLQGSAMIHLDMHITYFRPCET